MLQRRADTLVRLRLRSRGGPCRPTPLWSAPIPTSPPKDRAVVDDVSLSVQKAAMPSPPLRFPFLRLLFYSSLPLLRSLSRWFPPRRVPPRLLAGCGVARRCRDQGRERSRSRVRPEWWQRARWPATGCYGGAGDNPVVRRTRCWCWSNCDRHSVAESKGRGCSSRIEERCVCWKERVEEEESKSKLLKNYWKNESKWNITYKPYLVVSGVCLNLLKEIYFAPHYEDKVRCVRLGEKAMSLIVYFI